MFTTRTAQHSRIKQARKAVSNDPMNSYPNNGHPTTPHPHRHASRAIKDQICKHCKKRGHSEEECWSKKIANGITEGVPICDFCDRHGHESYQCRTKEKSAGVPPTAPHLLNAVQHYTRTPSADLGTLGNNSDIHEFVAFSRRVSKCIRMSSPAGSRLEDFIDAKTNRHMDWTHEAELRTGQNTYPYLDDEARTLDRQLDRIMMIVMIS